ncbi:alpha/beta hydrolase [Kineosporia sp. NBRC 101677]|uniref:alpha/beta fold hydrolase n=1 Tax=Kineosporia sp. NBRC 101677 TaxID=3032197 RepID=UPI0024A51DF3|nr:alpha/beta fold hydrolase [Kineosporia sp. NBRC 101677]GLY14466.1 alpha/beta hydrolase [Kineosporia sp. NBRC 101677]
MPLFTNADVTMEYERHGDPEGRPVFVHHGMLGSAGIAPQWGELATDAGVSLITVARPGYGQSTPVAMQSIADWAALLAPLADNLGLPRFSALGISSGAPYCYALAAALPDRLDRVAVLAGVGMVNEPETRAHYPEEAQRTFETYAQMPETDVRKQWFENLTVGLAQMPPEHPLRRPLTDSIAHEAAGPAREWVLQQRDWGFDLRTLSTPVTLWHSPADDQVPFAAAEIVAARIPGAVLHEQTEPGHFPSEPTVRAALSFLGQ